MRFVAPVTASCTAEVITRGFHGKNCQAPKESHPRYKAVEGLTQAKPI
jgi:hypothetical protein